jgi:hypothetical protein
MYHMSSSFEAHNKDGLTAQSFAMYGQKLMIAAARLVSKKDPLKGGLKGADLLKMNYPISAQPDGH